MKTHTAISAIYQPLLREKLERQGITFAAPDFLEKEAFLAELAVTDATHAIAHISVLEPRIRKELQAIRKANPAVQLIIIAPAGTMKDKKLMDIFAEFCVRIVEDGSRSLIESIIKIVDEEPEKASTSEPEPSTTDPVPAAAAADSKPVREAPARTPEPAAPPQPGGELRAAAKPVPAQRSAFKLPSISLPSFPKKESLKSDTSPHLRKPHVTTVIPIFSGSRGAGCTWLSVQIASYITQHNMTAAVCGATDMCLMGTKYVKTGDAQFTIKDVDFFPYAKPTDLISAGYDYIIFDVGVVMDFEPDGTAYAVADSGDMMEVMRAACKIMVCELGLWRQSAAQQILTKPIWKPLADATCFAASCRSSVDNTARFAAQHDKPFAHLPNAEPFEITADVRAAVEQLLQPIMQ